jgi:hypothetical protein
MSLVPHSLPAKQLVGWDAIPASSLMPGYGEDA